MPGVGTRTTETHCPYCSLQCGVTMTAGDRPATLVPADFPTNRGGLCSKGWSAPELLDHPHGLTPPPVPAAPVARPARARARTPVCDGTWYVARVRVTAAIRRTQAQYGRDAVGCFGG